MIVKIYTYDQFTPLFGNICESESTPKHIYAWERLNKIVAAPATLLIWCCDDHYRGSINLWGLFSQRPNQLLRNIFSKLATFGVKYWKHLIENIWRTKGDAQQLGGLLLYWAPLSFPRFYLGWEQQTQSTTGEREEDIITLTFLLACWHRMLQLDLSAYNHGIFNFQILC